MLKWHTPIEGLTSNSLAVIRNGNKLLSYDGISMKRSSPGPGQFTLVATGQTMTLMFDVSEAYDMTKAGKYSIAVDTYLEYAVGSVKGMNKPDQPGIPIKIRHPSPPPVSFVVVWRKPWELKKSSLS